MWYITCVSCLFGDVNASDYRPNPFPFAHRSRVPLVTETECLGSIHDIRTSSCHSQDIKSCFSSHKRRVYPRSRRGSQGECHAVFWIWNRLAWAFKWDCLVVWFVYCYFVLVACRSKRYCRPCLPMRWKNLCSTKPIFLCNNWYSVMQW
jgi:hypothetical protein